MHSILWQGKYNEKSTEKPLHITYKNYKRETEQVFCGRFCHVCQCIKTRLTTPAACDLFLQKKLLQILVGIVYIFHLTESLEHLQILASIFFHVSTSTMQICLRPTPTTV